MLEILATSVEFPEYTSVILDRKLNTVSQERKSLWMKLDKFQDL